MAILRYSSFSVWIEVVYRVSNKEGLERADCTKRSGMRQESCGLNLSPIAPGHARFHAFPAQDRDGHESSWHFQTESLVFVAPSISWMASQERGKLGVCCPTSGYDQPLSEGYGISRQNATSRSAVKKHHVLPGFGDATKAPIRGC